MDKVFEALASTPRRKILAYLSAAELSAGDIASRFEMTKPSLSKHLKILENAGLILSEKRGQFVFYKIQSDNLTNTLASFVQAVCPVSRGLKKESKAIANKVAAKTSK
jgi:ArsR family transcriptional regulator, arsenate/arsenite/antimonite-responsive transcriptional repressor